MDLKEADDAAVSRGIKAAKGEERPRSVERRVVEAAHGASGGARRHQRVAFPQRFAGALEAVSRERPDLGTQRGTPSRSNACTNGVIRHTGCSKTARSITRGEMYTS
jgi:hypothetical protein